jgi:hypothetical protein
MKRVSMEDWLSAATAVVGAVLLFGNQPPRSVPAAATSAEQPKRRVGFWECLTAIATALAALAAGITIPLVWSQADSARNAELRATVTESRAFWSGVLTQFDSDEMANARATLVYFHNLLGKDPDLVRNVTADHLAYYIYSTRLSPPEKRLPLDKRPFSDIKDEDTDVKKKEYFQKLDNSRRHIKNFHQDIVVLSKLCLISDALRIQILKERLYNAAGFLEENWLPIEFGQNRARRPNNGDEDDRACEIVAWLKANTDVPVTVAGCPSLANVERRAMCPK